MAKTKTDRALDDIVTKSKGLLVLGVARAVFKVPDLGGAVVWVEEIGGYRLNFKAPISKTVRTWDVWRPIGSRLTYLFGQEGCKTMDYKSSGSSTCFWELEFFVATSIPFSRPGTGLDGLYKDVIDGAKDL